MPPSLSAWDREIDWKRRRDSRRKRTRSDRPLQGGYILRVFLCMSLYRDVLFGTASLPSLLLCDPLWHHWSLLCSAVSTFVHSGFETVQLTTSSRSLYSQQALKAKICSVYLSGPPGSSHLAAGQALHLFVLWRVKLIHTQWCVIMRFILPSAPVGLTMIHHFYFQKTDFSLCCIFTVYQACSWWLFSVSIKLFFSIFLIVLSIKC